MVTYMNVVLYYFLYFFCFFEIIYIKMKGGKSIIIKRSNRDQVLEIRTSTVKQRAENIYKLDNVSNKFRKCNILEPFCM